MLIVVRSDLLCRFLLQVSTWRVVHSNDVTPSTPGVHEGKPGQVNATAENRFAANPFLYTTLTRHVKKGCSIPQMA